MAPAPLQLWPHRWSNLFSLSPRNHCWVILCTLWTPELTLRSCHHHIHASLVYQPNIQTKSWTYTVIHSLQRICIQSMEGIQLPHPCSWLQHFPSTLPATDDHSIPQALINTMWWAIIYLWHPSHRQATSTYLSPQHMALTIPGQTTMAGKPSGAKTMQLQQYHKISHSTNNRTISYSTTRVE